MAPASIVAGAGRDEKLLSSLDTRRVPFSWSNARDQLFAECLRKYYWRYYAPYGGNAPWETADRERLHVLRRVTNVAALVGDRVHRVARAALRSAHGGSPWREDEYIPAARLYLQRALRGSERAARVPPSGRASSAAILDAHYYRLPFDDHHAAEALERTIEYTRALWAHPLFQSALAHPNDLLAIDTIDRYELQGVTVYIVPDVVQRLPGGTHRLVDWKTGRSVSQRMHGYEQQLLVYALGLRLKRGLAVDAIECLVADLHNGASVAVPLDDDTLQRASARIVSSITAMQGLLRDQSLNRAHIDDYPMLADPDTPLDDLPDTCRRCAYRLPCYGERTLGWDGVR